MRHLCLLLTVMICAAPGIAAGENIADDLPLNPALTPPAPLHEQVLTLPGDPLRPVSLEVTLFTPSGNGPFPLAVLNHGANGTKEKPREMARVRYTFLAYYFLSRGYAVAMPMMRGYANSEGKQGGYGCDLARQATDNGRDIAGVIEALGSNPQIDSNRVVVAGQSFGGWNTLGLGAMAPPNVLGLIDFFGGEQSSGCKDGDAGDGASLIDGARRMGAETSLPSLWFYGENDSLFGPAIWQPMHRMYTEAGGKAELVDIGAFEDDSHQMLSHAESLPIWAPKADQFLASIGLPAQAINPDYLPMPLPAPTNFAAIDDVNAVPWVHPEGKLNYQKFLTRKFPRVFLITANGGSAEVAGGFDPLARAFGACARGHLQCIPYAINNDVVWHAPVAPKLPPPSGFADINNADAVPWVSEKGRDTYWHFLSVPAPRAFVIGTGGQSVATQGGADPLGRAMALCQKAGLDCRAYAVDNQVVWVNLPSPKLPPASGYAKIEDIAAVPWVNPRGRAAYANFLSLPFPRAFVVAPGGQSVTAQSGYDPLARALTLCRQHMLNCHPYAINDRVIWVPLLPLN